MCVGIRLVEVMRRIDSEGILTRRVDIAMGVLGVAEVDARPEGGPQWGPKLGAKGQPGWGGLGQGRAGTGHYVPHNKGSWSFGLYVLISNFCHEKGHLQQ